MGLMKFGYTVDMIALQNPATAESFFVGYDLDGVLKQKDHLGNITPIGSVTSIVGASSNFFLTGTESDSYGNKTASIYRPGDIRIGTTYSYTEVTSNSISLNINTGGTTSTFFTINDSYLQIDGSSYYGAETLYWDPTSGFYSYSSDYSYQSGLSSYQLSLYDSTNTTNIYANGFAISGVNKAVAVDTTNDAILYVSSGNNLNRICASFSRFVQFIPYYTNTLTLLPTTLSGDQVQYYQNKSGTFSLVSDVIDSSLFYLAGSTSSVINSKTQSIYRTGNIGIGTASPSTKLHIFATQSGVFRLQDGTQGSNYILTSDSNGVATWTSLSNIGVSGSASYIPKFTGTSSLGNSRFFDDGTSGSYGTGVYFLSGSNIYLSLVRSQSRMDFTLGNPSINQSGIITSQNTLGLDLKSQGYLALSSGPSYNEVMRITSVGNVAIGLTSATTKLHVYATQSSFGFRLQDGSQGNNYILTSNSIGMASWTSSISVTGFKLQNGTQQVGYVLTSDANGVGTWTASAVSTDNNIAIGYESLGESEGSNNTAIGYNSGYYLSDGFTTATSSNNSLFIGYNTKPQSNNQTNQIVIGYDTNGSGSNSVTLGNSSITKTQLRGKLNVSNVPVYADNAAALSGGLVTDDIYKTSTGVLMIVY